jgi:pilus assembly protein CpaE
MVNNNKLKVVLVGRSERALMPLAEALAQKAAEIACSIHLISDGQADTLSDLEPIPDVLVLRFDADTLPELAALANSNPDSRPPLIVVGPAGDPEAVRLAVRSGARDFLPEPVDAKELISAVERLRDEPSHGHGGSRRADVIVVLGAAGGVGTSLVACNLALAFATQTKAPTLLLDLDINGAPQTNFLDTAPGLGLPAALAEVEYLDEQALVGYVAKHRSGLRVMGAPAKSLLSPRDVDPDRFAKLMGLLSANFRYIVVDASHALDDMAVTTIGMAKRVVLVVQQSVLQLKQAARILGTVCNEIGIPNDRILIVINRYLKHSTVALDDIRRALSREQLTVLPSHYKSVLASIDSGLPLLEYDHSSPVAKGIIELQREIAGGVHIEHRSLLQRALPIFSGD